MSLVYLLLVTNVILRFLTNYIGFLPKALNISDVIITILLSVTVLFSNHTSRPFTSSFKRRLILFNVVLFLGALLNLGALYYPAALAQAIILSEPILLFVAMMSLPVDLSHTKRFDRILRKLIILEFVFGLLQFPIYLLTGQTEAIVGTFSGNAEQYTGFLLLGACYYLGFAKVDPANKRKYNALVTGLLFLIPFVDNKASWFGMIAALWFLMSKLGTLNRNKLKYTLIFVGLIIMGGLLVMMASSSLYKFASLTDAWETGNVSNLGKIKAYSDVFTAFANSPHMALVGSGPKTFYSRAAQQFYLITDDLFSNPSEYRMTFTTRTSNSMGGVIDPTSSVEPFYKKFYINQKIYSIGSAQVDSPFSSYVGLLGETGLIGLVIYVSFYVMIFRRLKKYYSEFHDDPNVFPILTAAMGFLIYTITVSLYNP